MRDYADKSYLRQPEQSANIKDWIILAIALMLIFSIIEG